MKAHNVTIAQDWGGDQPHPTGFPVAGFDFGVQCEPAFMLDCVGPQAFHRRSRPLAVQANRFFAGETRTTGQSKNIIDPVGPGQHILSKITLPSADAMSGKLDFPGDRPELRRR